MTFKFSPFNTSAKLLHDFATSKWCNQENEGRDNQLRYLMVCDLYIKARAYIIINKWAFWMSIPLAISVIIWPLFASISEHCKVGKEILEQWIFDKEVLSSPIAQATITAFAAFTFSIYNRYKKRQMYMENLMRFVIYSEDAPDILMEKVSKWMERIDAGFAFSEVLNQKNEEPNNL